MKIEITRQFIYIDNTMCSWTNEVKGTNSQPKTKWITASGDISGLLKGLQLFQK